MALVNKIESNSTGLRYALETSPGVVDGSAVWYPLEPNSYKNFGGEVKIKQRMPINASRQLKKGVVVDLDAMGGIVQDITPNNSSDILQTFMCAVIRDKDETAVATVDGTGNAYQPASGGTAFWSGDLIFAQGYDSLANEGLKQVTGVPTDTNVAVTDTGLVDGATQTSGKIERVGYQFSAGQVTVDVSGDYPKLVVVSVKALGTLTGDGTNITDGDTVTIAGVVYTFQDTLTNVAGHVKKAATAPLSLTNLFHAINASGGVVGTDYATLCVAHPRVVATNPSATTVVVTARAGGAIGNAITTTEVSSHLAWGAATLASGAGGRSFDSFGLIPGEFVFVGGDAAATKFFATTDKGFARVRTVLEDSLELDKTQFAMVADDGTDTGSGGTGQTIRLFFGRVLKNESDETLIVRRSVQLERTLGAPDSALPTQIQAEYLTRSLGDVLKIDMKTADIIRIELDFISGTHETRTGAVGVKAGTRPELDEADAFNSTSDAVFTKMAVVTAGDSAPTPLFSFFTDLAIDVKNNVKQNKAISVLGSFDSTLGFFEVAGSLSAYFTSVDELQVVRNNSSVTIETHMVKENKGISIDLPLVVLAKARAEVKINESVMIPLETNASTAKTIDPNLDYTLLWMFWKYLPDLAG